MNNSIKYWLFTAAACLLFLSSCLKNNPETIRIMTLGTTQCNPRDSTEWWFMGDDSVTYVAAERLTEIPRRNFRAIAVMDMVGGKKIGYDYVVSFVELRGVATNPVTATSQTSIDTAVNNTIEVVWANTSLHFLNINVRVWASNQLHKFSLLRDSTQTTEPIKLILRHNANKDAPINQVSGVISFDLETLAERNTRDSVRLSLITPGGDSASFTYRFHK